MWEKFIRGKTFSAICACYPARQKKQSKAGFELVEDIFGFFEFDLLEGFSVVFLF